MRQAAQGGWPPRRAGRGKLAISWTLCLALAFCPALARATPPSAARQSGMATASAAKQAFDAGDFTRAADLYWQAHLLDPADGPYLFALARCLHAGQQWERAARRYREFLALPTGHPSLRVRAAKYLQEVEAELERQGAVRPEPATSEVAVPQPVQSTPTELPAAATAAVEAVSAGKLQAPPVVVRPAQEPLPAGSPWPRRAVLGSGAALMATGAAVFAVFTAERWAFEDAMQPGFGGAKVTAFDSRAAASQRAVEIANRQNLGLGLLAGGAAAVALGLWLGREAGERPAENLSLRAAVGPGLLAVEGRW